MKCDELKRETRDVDYGLGPIPVSFYDADKVDDAIAELKDKVKLCSDFELAARKDIEEMREQHQMLKQFGHYKLSPVPGEMINHEVRQYVSYNVVCMIINHLESENAELKQKLEDAKATAYAESVDAGMRERRLRRLLWHAIALFCARSCEYFNGIMSHCLMGQNDLYRRCEEKKNKYLNAMYKCRAKWEEYK